MDVKLAGRNRQKQIAELEEWREKAYHNAKLYKERTKRWQIIESSKKSSSKETKFFYSTPRSNSSVTENFEASGKEHTPSSTRHHMARSQFKMTKVMLLR